MVLEASVRDKMVGRTSKSDVKSRLGNRGAVGGRAKPGKIRDARDVLRKKVPAKGRLGKTENLEAKGRVRRLMPLGDMLLKRKSVTYSSGSSSKGNIRTLSLTSGSLRVTTKQPELCRKTIVSKNSLKVVTPSNTVSRNETPTSSSSTPTRTLTNDLFTRERRSPLTSHMDDDLRASRPSLSFTREERPLFSSSFISKTRETTEATPATNHKILTKIVVTNLHPRVVQEDIAELFGAIGPLTHVKLSNCVAEVTFVKADHADMAYQKYHNRMLDGLPMKCTLGLANAPSETSREHERLNYHGAELVYPQTSSRPVVFQVRI